MRVVMTRADGVTIYEGRFMVARVSPAPVERQEPLARQFAASDEMLAVCKMLTEIKREFILNPECTAPDIGALSDAIEMARAVIMRVEGESCE